MNLQHVREAKAAKVAAARALVDKASAEKRSLSADETASFNTLKGEIESLEADEARAGFLADAEKRMTGTHVAGDKGDTLNRLQGQVSVLRVLQAAVEGRSLTGAEAEYHAEAERRTGRKAQGVFIPMAAMEQRVNTTSTMPELVGTDYRPDLFIGPLRNRLLARKLGVRVLSGLQGNLVIPKHGTGLSVGWVAENSAVPESDMTPDSVTLSPKHAGGVTELSRQLILQASPDVEQLVRDEFAFLLAQAIDSALIKGGGANEPDGVLSTVGIQTGSLATLNWANVLAMKTLADTANVDAVNWVMNPAAAAKFAGTEKSTGTGQYLLGDDGKMAGLPVYVTNQVPNETGTPDSGIAILGDWSQVMLGIWSEVDILVNPYAETPYRRGGVLVRAMSTVDIAVRHPEAFVVASDVVL